MKYNFCHDIISSIIIEIHMSYLSIENFWNFNLQKKNIHFEEKVITWFFHIEVSYKLEKFQTVRYFRIRSFCLQLKFNKDLLKTDGQSIYVDTRQLKKWWNSLSKVFTTF